MHRNFPAKAGFIPSPEPFLAVMALIAKGRSLISINLIQGKRPTPDHRQTTILGKRKQL